MWVVLLLWLLLLGINSHASLDLMTAAADVHVRGSEEELFGRVVVIVVTC